MSGTDTSSKSLTLDRSDNNFNNSVNMDDSAQNFKNNSFSETDVDHNIYTGVLEISIDKRYGFPY